MSKKKCPQCKNLISESAPTCLYCGRPNKFITKDYINKKWNKDKKNKLVFYNILTKKNIFILFAFLIFFIILFKYN